MRITYKSFKRFVPGVLVSLALITTVAVLLYVSFLDNERPDADIEISSSSVLLGESVVFDGSGSSDPDGDPIDYLWTIDSRFTTTDANFTFTFSEPGTHTIILKVSDGTGKYDTATVLVDVLQ